MVDSFTLVQKLVQGVISLNGLMKSQPPKIQPQIVVTNVGRQDILRLIVLERQKTAQEPATNVENQGIFQIIALKTDHLLLEDEEGVEAGEEGREEVLVNQGQRKAQKLESMLPCH